MAGNYNNVFYGETFYRIWSSGDSYDFKPYLHALLLENKEKDVLLSNDVIRFIYGVMSYYLSSEISKDKKLNNHINIEFLYNEIMLVFIDVFRVTDPLCHMSYSETKIFQVMSTILKAQVVGMSTELYKTLQEFMILEYICSYTTQGIIFEIDICSYINDPTAMYHDIDDLLCVILLQYFKLTPDNISFISNDNSENYIVDKLLLPKESFYYTLEKDRFNQVPHEVLDAKIRNLIHVLTFDININPSLIESSSREVIIYVVKMINDLYNIDITEHGVYLEWVESISPLLQSLFRGITSGEQELNKPELHSTNNLECAKFILDYTHYIVEDLLQRGIYYDRI